MKIQRNKKAIQLSINFIVMLVLGIAMFMGGMVFIGKFFTQAKEIKGSLDSQTERQIEAMLDSGSAFVIPIHTKEGSRKDILKYGICIYNDGRPPASTQFSININFDSAFSKTKTPLCQANSCAADEIPQLTYLSTAEIAPDKKHVFVVVVEIPQKTQSGTYIYTVESLQGGQKYEPALQMMVKVK